MTMSPTLTVPIGCVLKTHVTDTKPPKIKRFIVVGRDDENISLATIYINSEVNTTVHWSIEQKDLQLEFASEGRDYLNRTSYVDCTKLYIKELIIILEAIKKDPNTIIGQLSEDDLKMVTNKLADATTIKGKHKKKYGIYTRSKATNN